MLPIDGEHVVIVARTNDERGDGKNNIFRFFKYVTLKCSAMGVEVVHGFGDETMRSEPERREAERKHGKATNPICLGLTSLDIID